MPGRLTIPVSLAGHHLAAASQAAALEQLREKLETGEPPEKKMALMAEEQQRLVQHALQQNLLAMASQLPMSVKIGSRGTCRKAGASGPYGAPRGAGAAQSLTAKQGWAWLVRGRETPGCSRRCRCLCCVLLCGGGDGRIAMEGPGNAAAICGA